ncbi:MAG: family 16 glycosylhydrolase [Terriglobus roseus]|nr:family 16 glycosylhydrolase [Terriglobus roseus]
MTNGIPDNWAMTSGGMKTSPKGGLFQINSIDDGPTIASNFHIHFGSVEITMQAAPGAGIVSTYVMESMDLDEIDVEIIGSETGRIQSNYFGKGNTTTYDRGEYHPVNSPQTTFHTYKVDWKPDTTQWYVDGQLVRTLHYADAVGGKNYPQTPCNIRIGNWVAGHPGNNPGTIQWAGGLANFNNAPFNMYVTKVNIQNYNPCAAYEYSDRSGDWRSIKCASGPKSSASPSSKPVPTSTKTSTKQPITTSNEAAVTTSSSTSAVTYPVTSSKSSESPVYSSGSSISSEAPVTPTSSMTSPRP